MSRSAPARGVVTRSGRLHVTPALCTLLLMLAGAAVTARAQSFSLPNSYNVGPNPNAAAAGDFNGDGKPDLAVGNTLGANVTILLNNGNGTFTVANTVSTDLNPEGVAAGDFNKDGKLDLAVGNFRGGPSSTGNISILMGKGDGTFQSPVNFNAVSPHRLTATDLDADGNLDLVTASWTADHVSVLLGKGDGTFEATTTFAVGDEPREVAVGDFNKDGKPDLAVANFMSSNISLLQGNGDGTFQAAVNIPAGGVTSIAAADLNGDENLDLAAGAPNAGVAVVLVGNGDGTFKTPANFPAGANTGSIQIADFNGDAKLDVALAVNAGSVAVLRGNGDGTLQAAANYPAQTSAFSLLVSDFNTDGKPDVAVTNNGIARVNVLLNSPSPRGAAFNATATVAATNVQVASFTDFDASKTAAQFTATINWGDGTADTAGTVTADGSGGFRVTGSHTYAKEGVYNVTTKIADGQNNFAEAVGTATVADAPLTASGKIINTFRRAAFNGIVASFIDADPTSPLTEYSATINWGDGSTSQGTIISNGGGSFDIAGSHTYLTTGSFSIGVVINTLGGSTANANSTANVANLTISGHVKRFDGTPLSGVEVALSGPDSGTVTTGADGSYSFTVGAGGPYTITPSKTNFVFSPPAVTVADLTGNLTADFSSTRPALQFSLANYSAAEGDGSALITVTRVGDRTEAATVDYATSDGTANVRNNYTPAYGTLSFGVGEASKSFPVLITENGHVTGSRTVNLSLHGASGALLGTQGTAVLTIEDNDAVAPVVNPNDISQTFVRQHYHDFFSREPDAPGLAHWTGVIESCGADAQCREVTRINVSAAFFLSIEFQQTGYLVVRTYKAAFGDATGSSTLGTAHQLTVPVIRLDEFLPDTQRIGRGVIVNQGDWQARLEANKAAFMLEFVRRPRFLADYPPSLTPADFVDRLNGRAGGPLDAAERQALIDELTADNTEAGRASVLRKVAEDPTLHAAELNRAFVLMQYFGYLRRDPNTGPDTDYTGYDFWLSNLNRFNGNFVQAELVKAFISSAEYRQRFGQ